jgi:nitrite reductase/ring-hydroxylating ferredoxin subunit
MSGSGEWHRVAATSDVAEGEAKAIEIMGLNLALYHVGGEWFCTDNECTHAFALLTDGWLDGHLVECPLHNGQFDIRTGKAQGSPADEDLRAYPVKVEQTEVSILLP